MAPATSDDVAFLRKLFVSTKWEELGASQAPDAMLTVMLEQQFTAQSDALKDRWPDASDLIVSRQNRPVGRLYVSFSDRHAHVIDLAVLPEVQSNGIGTALVNILCSAARERGAQVTLRAVDGGRAERFYARLGFDVTGREAPYVEMCWDGGAKPVS